jgi:hypothetical protein
LSAIGVLSADISLQESATASSVKALLPAEVVSNPYSGFRDGDDFGLIEPLQIVPHERHERNVEPVLWAAILAARLRFAGGQVRSDPGEVREC